MRILFLSLILSLWGVVSGDLSELEHLHEHDPLNVTTMFQIADLLVQDGSMYRASTFYNKLYSISPRLAGLSELKDRLVQTGAPEELFTPEDDVKTFTENVMGINMTFGCFNRKLCLDLTMVGQEQMRDSYGLTELLFEKGDWVLDAGGNIGVFATALALRYPDVKVVSLEPSPVAFRTYVFNTRLNRVHNRAIPLHAALTAHGNPVKITFDPSRTSASTIYYSNAPDFYTTQLKLTPQHTHVPSVTVQQVMALFGMQELALLKMDCEGCEFEVLPTLPRHSIHVIRGEVHGPYAPDTQSLMYATHILDWAGKPGRWPKDSQYGKPAMAGAYDPKINY